MYSEYFDSFQLKRQLLLSPQTAESMGFDTSEFDVNDLVTFLQSLDKSEALEAARPIGAGAYPGFCSMMRLEVFLLPLDGMLVHRRSLPRKLSGFPQQFAGTHLYTWVVRGIVRVKCLA